MYDTNFINNTYGYILNKMRNGKRKQYWYLYALRFKNSQKELYPAKADAIQQDWDKNWHKKFMKAVA